MGENNKNPLYDENWKDVNKKVVNEGVSSTALAFIILLGIAVLVGIILIIKNLGFMTVSEREAAKNKEEAEKVARAQYSVSFSRDEDFYHERYVLHNGVIYIRAYGFFVKDMSELGAFIGKTSKDLDFSLDERKAEEGSKNLLPSGASYYEYTPSSNFIAVNPNFKSDTPEDYILLVNEDFYDFYKYGKDFDIFANNLDIIEGINVVRYVNRTAKTSSVEMDVDTYKEMVSRASFEDEVNIIDYQPSAIVEIRFEFKLKGGLNYSRRAALLKYSEDEIVWYKDDVTGNSKAAYVYRMGSDAEFDNIMLEYFKPDIGE